MKLKLSINQSFSKTSVFSKLTGFWKRLNLILSILVLLYLFNIQTIAAQSRAAAFPRLEPDPKALAFHNLGRQDDYTWLQLAEIALWASGDTSAANLQRIRDAAANLNNSADLPSSAKEKAEFILEFMHRTILRSYSLYQTRVDTVFTNGRFNCVSSAVLYVILCKSAGINASGVMTRDHAFAIVHIDGEDIDVETTNRFGFDPGNRREFHDQFGRLTGFTYVPAQNYRDRQTISQIELVSLIMNNRIADAERASRYAESVPIAVDRAALLMGNIQGSAGSSNRIFENPLKDVMDRLINFGAMLLRSNREEDTLRWTAAASALYPDPSRWPELTMAAVNNRITRFIRDRRITEARNFLESSKNLLTHEDYAQFDASLLDTELLGRINQINTAAEGDAAVNMVEQARNTGRVAEKRASELITFAVLRTAQILSAAPNRNWRAAVNYIEGAISRFGAAGDLNQALRTYRGNLAADYHNRFAAEWNRRNHDEAARILEEGLAEFPDDRQLLANRETVNRQRSR